MKIYGLIGSELTHSFSADYFNRKFEQDYLPDNKYRLFPIPTLHNFRRFVEDHQEISGLNVTIPYKEQIIRYLDDMDPSAAKIGAVNCIQVRRSSKKIILKGYNTDVTGFEKSIKPFLQPHHSKALIMGTGGSSKAVAYVLKNLGIEYLFVSRNPHDCAQVRYEFITLEILSDFQVIVNTTPVGMYPKVNEFPPIPYEGLTNLHLLFDLIYNPEETEFLKKGRKQGSTTCNGLAMLYAQADASWVIWNS